MYLAKHKLKMPVEQVVMYIDKLDHIEEAGACGTAAIITPVGSVTYQGKKHVFPCHETIGPVTKKLHEMLLGIQFGDLEDPDGWITVL